MFFMAALAGGFLQFGLWKVVGRCVCGNVVVALCAAVVFNLFKSVYMAGFAVLRKKLVGRVEVASAPKLGAG